MGELYGSEYWTYLLPRRVGQAKALELTQACEPLGTKEACAIGLLDEVFGADAESFETELRARVALLSQDAATVRAMLRDKHERRLDDEAIKPLASYRHEELERMKVNFFGPDPAYHEARRRFVFKGDPPAKGETRPAAGAPSAPMEVGLSPGLLLSGLAQPAKRNDSPATQPTLGAWMLRMFRKGVEGLPRGRDQ
jgi:putative two-component system hydrogenase maturation factor HypX/HoxX